MTRSFLLPLELDITTVVLLSRRSRCNGTWALLHCRCLLCSYQVTWSRSSSQLYYDRSITPQTAGTLVVDCHGSTSLASAAYSTTHLLSGGHVTTSGRDREQETITSRGRYAATLSRSPLGYLGHVGDVDYVGGLGELDGFGDMGDPIDSSATNEFLPPPPPLSAPCLARRYPISPSAISQSRDMAIPDVTSSSSRRCRLHLFDCSPAAAAVWTARV